MHQHLEIRSVRLLDTKDLIVECATAWQEAGFKEALKYNGEFIDSQQLKVEKCVSDGKKERHPKSDKPNRKQFQQPAPKVIINVIFISMRT